MYRSAPIKEGQLVRRSIEQRDLVVDQESRTVELSFASDFEVERYDWIERLSMTGMDMTRIGSGKAALLMDHDSRDQVGVVESVTVGSDNIARAKVRFSRSARGQEIFQDVVDGIRSLVSVGYRIHEIELASTKDGISTYEVTRWEPFEISIVSIPADPTVGVGRSADLAVEKPVIEAAPEITPDPVAETRSLTAPQKSKESIVDEIQKAIAAANQRAADILALGDRHGANDAAREFVASGKSVDEFRQHLLERPAPVIKTAATGMSDKEARSFSYLRFLNAAATGDWSRAGFEREAVAAAQKSLGRDAKGHFIPMEVQRASQHTVGTPANGGYTVQTEYMGLIDTLQARLLTRRMGATVFDGAVGNLSFNKNLGGSAVTWVGEDGPAANTVSTFGQFGMTPKTALAKTSISRKLMIQSSMAFENHARNELARAMAVGLDKASLIGGGANEPVGLLGGGLAAGRKLVVGAGYTWDEIVGLETKVATVDADIGALGYLTNAGNRGALKVTPKVAGTSGFIWENGTDGFGELNGYRAGVTSQLAGAVDMIFGNWADLYIAFWSGLDVVVDSITDDSGAHIVKVYQDCDVAIARQESFAYGAAA
jgi:HK97 family phage major capsid protein